MIRKNNVAKVVIVGHVGHGKSTLIGRLLYDAGGLNNDMLNDMKSGGGIDFANLTDQLREEREGDLTIDSSQVFFHTKSRRYVVIDTPGHVEFLKNMLTGASQADIAVLIVDAKEGVMEETRRHAYLLDMLGLHKAIVVVNKMDVAGYRSQCFDEVKSELLNFLESIHIAPAYVVPISAVSGANVAKASKETDWYGGPALLDALDSISFIADSIKNRPLRYPVQDVYQRRNKRIFVGCIESGAVKKGDDIIILPSKKEDKIESIEVFEGQKSQAEEGESIGVVLRNASAKRGDVLCAENSLPEVKDEIHATIFWIGQEPLDIKDDLIIKCATQEVKCRIGSVNRRINSSTLEELDMAGGKILHSESADVAIKTDCPLVVDDFRNVKELGRFILERDFDVVGAGIIRK